MGKVSNISRKISEMSLNSGKDQEIKELEKSQIASSLHRIQGKQTETKFTQVQSLQRNLLSSNLRNILKEIVITRTHHTMNFLKRLIILKFYISSTMLFQVNFKETR